MDWNSENYPIPLHGGWKGELLYSFMFPAENVREFLLPLAFEISTESFRFNLCPALSIHAGDRNVQHSDLRIPRDNQAIGLFQSLISVFELFL